jgi:putative MATE family efflux protein
MINPLIVGAVVLISNAVFDYFLIFGIGPFPRLGVNGAALATGISRVIGMILILWSLHRSVLRDSLKHLRVHISWFGRIMNIGIPAIIQAVPRTIAGVLLVAMIGGLSDATAAIAALTLGYTIEDLAYMPGVAYSTAAVPLVGQNLGAGKPGRAEKCAWVATKQAVGIMTLVAVFFVAIPKQLAMVFTNDQSVVSLTAWYLIINAACQPFLALGTVLRGALQGAGDVRIPAIINIITFCGVRLPMVWVFVYILHWGVISVWAAISGSAILCGILTLIWFKTNRWKTVEL